MLTIRQEQLVAFSTEESNKFEKRLLHHLKKFFPAQYQAAGDVKMRELVKEGIHRAASYGITAERDSCKYVDLMIVLGPDFDKDPKLPWAEKILTSHALEDKPASKVEQLCDIASGKIDSEPEAPPQRNRRENIHSHG